MSNMTELINGQLYTVRSVVGKGDPDKRWFKYYYSECRDRGAKQLDSLHRMLCSTDECSRELYRIKSRARVTYLRQKRDRMARVNRTIATRPIPDALVADVTGGAV